MNRIQNVLLLSILLLASLLAFLGYRYQKLENRNTQLRQKLEQIKNFKTAKKWDEIKAQKIVPAKLPKLEKSAAKEVAKTKASQDIQLVPTSELATHIEDDLADYTNLDEKQLENVIQYADEIIDREPDAYSAYKAKLISYLAMEAKNQDKQYEDEIVNLLEELASFDTDSDEMIREEAFLIARENIVTPTVDLTEEEFAEEEVEVIPEEVLVNQDLIEIYLQRTLAQGEFEDVMLEAQALIEEYPGALIGHEYLIRALELDGQLDEADDYISELNLNEFQLRQLEENLRRFRRTDPKNYWQELSF